MRDTWGAGHTQGREGEDGDSPSGRGPPPGGEDQEAGADHLYSRRQEGGQQERGGGAGGEVGEGARLVRDTTRVEVLPGRAVEEGGREDGGAGQLEYNLQGRDIESAQEAPGALDSTPE